MTQSEAKQRKPLWGAALLLGIGTLVGLLVAGGTVTVVEYTNQTEYCVSCHVYESLYEDYQATPHYSNASGYQADCVDCHLPSDNWWNMVTDKAAHGVHALWAYNVSGVNTPEKFADRREALGEQVFAWFEETNSMSCRHCHDASNWDLEAQSATAQGVHQRVGPEDGCIGCHRDDAGHRSSSGE